MIFDSWIKAFAQGGFYVFLLLVTVFICLTCNSSAVEVTAEGRAPLNRGTARRQAIADALREAVRKGAGVDLISDTKIDDFALQYDRIYSSATGYIKSYDIISESETDAGFHLVKIRAEVVKGNPETSRKLEILQFIELKGVPRLLVRAEENIKGIEDKKSPVSKSVIEEIAAKTGFYIVDSNGISESAKKAGIRAKLLGDNKGAAIRDQELDSRYDIEVRIETSGSLGPIEEIYGIKTRDLALGVQLTALYSDSGKVITKLLLPTAVVNVKETGLPLSAEKQIVRHYLMKLLKGGAEDFKYDNAYKFFNRMMEQWVVEMDRGKIIRLEFRSLPQEKIGIVADIIEDTSGISEGWIKLIDPELISVVEIRSTLTASQIQEEILRSLPGYKVDIVSPNSLSFKPESQKFSTYIWYAAGIIVFVIAVLAVSGIIFVFINIFRRNRRPGA